MPQAMSARIIGLLVVLCPACGGKASPAADNPSGAGDIVGDLPRASCDAEADGQAMVQAPELLTRLADRWHEAWLASPAVADLDADGENEIVVARDNLLLVWHLDGSEIWRAEVSGRIWSSPLVLDLRPELPGLEVALASRESIYAYGADGATLDGFPFAWRDELRALAAGDIDGDGNFELVAVTTSDLDENGQTDILIAVNHDGSVVDGFPPNTSGAAGCDDACYVHAGFDQTLALGDVNGDDMPDILAPQDNSYVSLHEGTGRAFDAASIFEGRSKFSGIRFMHDYAEAQQGYAEDEESANQAHFTNTAPAIADLDGDGSNELIMLGSVQNAAQSDRLRGVALWVLHNDGTRLPAWTEPLHFPDYLDGLWDLGDNIVGATNQVSVVELDPERSGKEMVFAGFDGRIHAVDAQGESLWQTTYTEDAGVLTGGVLVADLSRDGRPEIIFNSYAASEDVSALFILGADGQILQQLPLPGRGAMPVPTIADIDEDGQLEIVVSLKDAVEGEEQVRIYTVPGSAPNCVLWGTGRGNLLRDGWVR
jgi:hypothetical protein